MRANWDDSDSEDSFRIEPTNVGDYFDRMHELQERIIARNREQRPASRIQVQTPDETLQMIQQLRQKHLLRGQAQLPASPMSFAANARSSVSAANLEAHREDAMREDGDDLPEARAQDTSNALSTSAAEIARVKDQVSGAIDCAQGQESEARQPRDTSFDYSEWQKKNFINILKVLEKD